MAKPDVKRNADRARASRLRAKLDKGGTVSQADARWLQDYDASRSSENPSPIAAPPVVLTEAIQEGADVGASEEGREIKFSLKENKRAVGTGDAAAVAAGAAALNVQALAAALEKVTQAMAKAHSESTNTLKEAAGVYKSMCLDLRELTRDLLQSEITAREQYREHYLARIDVEGRLRALLKERVEKPAAEEKDPMDALVEEATKRLFGQVLDGVLPVKLPPGSASGHKPGAAANGTAKGPGVR